MKEGPRSVKRLLAAISQNIDESNLPILARLLNYYPSQLKEDIEEIDSVDIFPRGMFSENPEDEDRGEY